MINRHRNSNDRILLLPLPLMYLTCGLVPLLHRRQVRLTFRVGDQGESAWFTLHRAQTCNVMLPI